MICNVDSKSILDMMKLFVDSYVEELNITKLNSQYLTMKYHDRITLLQEYLCRDLIPPSNDINIMSDIFP
jgi:hypothetical protein